MTLETTPQSGANDKNEREASRMRFLNAAIVSIEKQLALQVPNEKVMNAGYKFLDHNLKNIGIEDVDLPYMNGKSMEENFRTYIAEVRRKLQELPGWEQIISIK